MLHTIPYKSVMLTIHNLLSALLAKSSQYYIFKEVSKKFWFPKGPFVMSPNQLTFYRENYFQNLTTESGKFRNQMGRILQDEPLIQEYQRLHKMTQGEWESDKRWQKINKIV